MFIFARNTKEIFVTAGAVVACLILLVFAVKSAFLGGYAWIISILSISLVVAIYKGAKSGYQIGRYLFGVSALLLALGGINNPIAYEDSVVEKWSYFSFELDTLGFIVVSMAMYCCLSEHAKLRRLW